MNRSLFYPFAILATILTAIFLDRPVTTYLADCAWSPLPFNYLSKLGAAPIMTTLLLPLFIAATYYGRKSLATNLFEFLSRLAAGIAIVTILKVVIGRARPELATAGAPLFAPLSFANGFYSFPSSHTVSTMMLALTLYRSTRINHLILMGYLVLIGTCRVVLLKHYPSDVLAAVVIGVFIHNDLYKYAWLDKIKFRIGKWLRVYDQKKRIGP